MKVNTERNSSIEVLRIIAMAMVLLTHYNWSMLGAAKSHVVFDAVGGARIIFESCIVICVNLFLLISGYFGLRFKLKSICNIGVLVISVLLLEFLSEQLLVPHFLNREPEPITFISVLNPILFISSSDYFVVDYIFLMVLSPILNTFINANGKKILPLVLILLGIELWFDCVRPNQYFGINGGYSIIHFIIMYMVARCLYLYKSELEKIKQVQWIVLYLVCAALVTIMYVLKADCALYYSNPLVVIESVAFFMLFVNKSFYNRAINWIASGTFSVYILHRYNPVHYIMMSVDTTLFSNQPFYLYVLYSIPFLVAIFMFAVCFDKLVGFVRKPVMAYCDKLQSSHLNCINTFN